MQIQIRDKSISRPGGRTFFQTAEFLDYQEQAHVFLVAAAGLFACWIPARRAIGVDPMEALRYE